MPARAYLFDGVKAQSLGDLDRWMEYQQTAADDTHGVYAAVPWVYRGVWLRSNAVSRVPFKITHKGSEDEYDYPLQHTLTRLFWATEAALCLYGAGYWMRGKNLVGVPGFRWLLPTSITPLTDEKTGLAGFTRKVGAIETVYPIEQLVYFWLPALDKEVGPGVAPAQAAFRAAGLSRYANEFASGFFERGAIPATVITVEGNPPQKELDRLEAWWKRLMQGVRRAWETVAVRAGVKPVVVGQPIKDLAMPELSQDTRRQIAAALGIPITMLEDAANYATAKEHHVQFYSETVDPECGLIAGSLNEQVFWPMGLELTFLIQQLDIMQVDESERAGSLKSLVDASVPLVLAMQMLGYDLPEGWTYEQLQAQFDEEKRRKEEASQALQERLQGKPASDASAQGQEETRHDGAATDAENRATAAKAAMLGDLARWRRKASRRGKPVEFESDAIPQSLVTTLKAAMGDVGLEAWRFLKAAPDARDGAEEALTQQVVAVLADHSLRFVRAIMSGAEPDYAALAQDLEHVLLPALVAIAYEVALREALELGIEFDTAEINVAAVEWARSYTFNLVQGLTETTRKVVASAIEQFISTPGMTEGELEALLEPAFGPVRAQMIAITEVTRAYSAATNAYQKLLAAAGIVMERVWNTANDERVCPICGPLHRQPESNWGDDLEEGPPAHVRCRCWTTLRVRR